MILPKPRKRPIGGVVFLVRGEHAKKPVWHYVLVDKLKLALFKKQLKTGELDVAQYGEILHSGWGENPPAEMVQAIDSHYQAIDSHYG